MTPSHKGPADGMFWRPIWVTVCRRGCFHMRWHLPEAHPGPGFTLTVSYLSHWSQARFTGASFSATVRGELRSREGQDLAQSCTAAKGLTWLWAWSSNPRACVSPTELLIAIHEICGCVGVSFYSFARRFRSKNSQPRDKIPFVSSLP